MRRPLIASSRVLATGPLASLAADAAFADFKPPACFSDHMVLQREIGACARFAVDWEQRPAYMELQ